LNFNSLKTKSLVWFFISIVAVLTLFNLLFYIFLEKNNAKITEAALFGKAMIFKKDINKFVKDAVIDNRQYPEYEIAILKQKNIISRTKNFPKKLLHKNLDVKEHFFIFSSNSKKGALYILDISSPFNGHIAIYQHEIDEKIESILDMMYLLNPLLFLLLMFIGVKLIDKTTKPIKDITDNAKKISIDNFNHNINKNYKEKELKELVDAFNEMISRIEDGTKRLERFNSDVSHELKTPITAIKGEIEVTLKRKREVKEYEQSLRSIDTQIDNIKNIVEDLLLLSKFSKDTVRKTFENCQVDMIILEIVENFRKLAKEKDIKIIIKQIEPVNITANDQMLKISISNLIDNAIKYSKEKKRVYISLYKKDKVYIKVEDEGIGIEKKNLPYLTDRFYRVDESRSKKIKGFGLGLSIVKNFIDLHGGEIKISSKQGKGTSVTLSFD